jgi:crossover junction endodeoxyribonuclease RusA
MIRLTLPLAPLLNRYYRKYRNMITISAEGQTFKAEVASICLKAGLKPLEGDVMVRARIYRKMRKGDIDGYAKATLDSLQGFAYIDDKQVIELHLIRDDDKRNPRIEIEICQTHKAGTLL